MGLLWALVKAEAKAEAKISNKNFYPMMILAHLKPHTRDKWVDYWNTKKYFFAELAMDLVKDLVKDFVNKNCYAMMILAHLKPHTRDKWVDYWNTKKYFFVFDSLNARNNCCNILLSLS